MAMNSRSIRLSSILTTDVSLTPRSGRQQLSELMQSHDDYKMVKALYLEGKLAIAEGDFDQAQRLLSDCDRIILPSQKYTCRNLNKYLQNCNIGQEFVRSGIIVDDHTSRVVTWLTFILGPDINEHIVKQYASALIKHGFTEDVIEIMNPWEIQDMAQTVQMSYGHFFAIRNYVMERRGPFEKNLFKFLTLIEGCLHFNKKYKNEIAPITNWMNKAVVESGEEEEETAGDDVVCLRM